MKAERGIYDCVHVSVTTARPARSKNRYKSEIEDRVYYMDVAHSFLAWLENLLVFNSLSPLLESKVSLR